MSEELVQWLSPVPGFCETCEGPIDRVFIDGKTWQGPWACHVPDLFHTWSGNWEIRYWPWPEI